ncbi:MAG: PaaI family thioesterase [Mogibacterium sp.]|nr:PaaI family thioesterase [Mogibacterium sp.]
MKEEYPFAAKLEIEYLGSDPMRARGRIRVTEDMTDMLGHVTGGIYNSLADAIGGAAARATGDMYVTQNCNMQFYQSTEPSDEYLYAEAEIRHRGSRTCIAAVELKHEDGTVVSDGQFSYSKI